MYQADLMEAEWQYIIKVLNLQERKKKQDLRTIWNAILFAKDWLLLAHISKRIP